MKSRSNKIALGTVQFGLSYGINNSFGQTSEEEVGMILKYAWDEGIDMLDTARGYGNSEAVLGRQLTNEFKIVTKFPSGSSASEIETAFHASLNDLKVNRAYGILAHEANDLIKKPVLWDGLRRLKASQLVGKIGYSLYLPEQLKKLIDKNLLPDIVQVPFSFFDKRFQPFFAELKSMGTEIHVRSVFLQGLFFQDPASLPSYFDPVKAILRQLQNEFDDKSELAAWLLNFVLAHPDIDRVVIGVNNLQQLKNNLSGIKTVRSRLIQQPDVDESILLPYLWPQKN